MPQPDPITRALSAIDPRDAPALALLGHDLRATVSEVVGGLHLIDLQVLPREPRDQIARSLAAAEAMALLLEQALILMLGNDPSQNFWRTPNERPGLQTAQMAQDITLRWSARAAANQQSFALMISPDLPSALAVDAGLFERVLSNLLGNAMKHAGPGKISCSISLSANHTLCICVQDDGKGFPDPQALFSPKPSAQSPNSESETAGSGLGLLIVADLVHRAGGTIAARNQAPHGAEVTVLLPLAELAPAPAHQSMSMPNLHGLRLLVADDSETTCLLLHTLLSSMGAEVTTVRDGRAAIGQIETKPFDALLVDVEMADFNGLMVVSHIRNLPPPQAMLPILAVTAYHLQADKQAIFAAGADDILAKPITGAAVLGDAILRVLLRKTGLSARPKALAQIDPTAFDSLLTMAGPAVAAELISRLLADLQASERALLAASHAPNWLAVQAQTHILIALAGTAGAPMLHHLAQNVNDLAHQPAPDLNTFRTLLPQMLESLDILIQFICQKSPQPKDSA